jgi:hypothetical protein
MKIKQLARLMIGDSPFLSGISRISTIVTQKVQRNCAVAKFQIPKPGPPRQLGEVKSSLRNGGVNPPLRH